jgi:hypothetical protein
MKRVMHTILGAALLSLTFGAAAQKPAAYPSKGQSASKQSKDDGECLTWAGNSTANNPSAQSASPQQTSPGGERVKGAARGAVGGAAIGAIAGDTGKGAGIGAVAGTMSGGKKQRDKQAEQSQQAQASNKESADAYYRAYGACMKGRGYTMN